MNDDSLAQAMSYAYFFLKFRPRSEYELREYLQKKSAAYGWKGDIIDRTISRLIELAMVDDRAFVAWYVHRRSVNKPKGERAIREELRRFHIPPEYIDVFFQENERDEDELAKRALEKKWNQLAGEPEKKRYQRAYSYLARRGFSYDSIKIAIAKLGKKR